MGLEPPPEASYHSVELAEAAIQQWAEAHGFATVRKRSRQDKRTPPSTRKVWVICDKGGRPRTINNAGDENDQEKANKSRKTGSRKTGCSFELTVTRTLSNMWEVAILEASHNHEPSLDPSAHPSHRKLIEDEKALVKSMRTTMKSKDMLLAMQQIDANTHVTLEDIRNEKKRLLKEELGGKTRTEALVERLTVSPNWSFSWEKDNNTNRLNRLFFAHHKGIELAQNYPEVLLIDATYKTNIYNMPLLHFAGVTPTGKNFSIGFAFMTSEAEAEYQWVMAEFNKLVYGEQLKPTVIVTDNEGALLKALDNVYPDIPHLLCRWHAEKNVLTKAQEFWRVTNVSDEDRKVNEELRDAFMRRWNECVRAKTKEAFEDLYMKLKNDYSHQSDLVAYLDDNKYTTKELFVYSWTSAFRHYGITVTSRIEGAHSCLKRFLATSRNDLLGVVNVINNMHNVQYTEARAELAQQRDRPPHHVNAKYNSWLEPNINTKIVPKALDLAKSQYKLISADGWTDNCSGDFERTMGIPCSHTINDLLQLKRKVTGAFFDQYWLFVKPEPAPHTNSDFIAPDPVIPRQPTNPLGSLPQQATLHLNNIDALLLDTPASQPAVLPPLKVRTKGRHRKKKLDDSTRREPSAFERNGAPQSSRVSTIL
jgi:hypothetical protein